MPKLHFRVLNRRHQALLSGFPIVTDVPSYFEGQLTVYPNGCWVWYGEHRKDGRPICGYKEDGSRDYVYRKLYNQLIRPLEKSEVLHHKKCNHKWCANPYHTEPMTQSKHMENHGSGITGFCKNGHPWVEGNISIDKKTGWKRCKICRRKGAK